MRTKIFTIPQQQLTTLLTQFPINSSSNIGKFAVEIAKLYFKSLNEDTELTVNKNGVDLSTRINDIDTNYEIKGTAKANISMNNLKVSSQNCYNLLVDGMELIRITNIGSTSMTLYFLKHDEDFVLVPEPRWSAQSINSL